MRSQITGIVLAGGLARRMGGRDKGLIPLNRKPLVEWTLRALRAQVGRIVINANRNTTRYAEFGYEVVSDSDSGFLGPLAGMASGMRAADTSHILTVPCDSPLIAPDLAARLWRVQEHEHAKICVAHDGNRLQPVFALIHTDLRSDLEAYLADGGRKIDRWFERHTVALADFSDCPENFMNVNEPEDVAILESALHAPDGAAKRLPENDQ